MNGRSGFNQKPMKIFSFSKFLPGTAGTAGGSWDITEDMEITDRIAIPIDVPFISMVIQFMLFENTSFYPLLVQEIKCDAYTLLRGFIVLSTLQL